MIVLLSCFTNLLINSFAAIPSTGGLEANLLTNDSVLISYNDLRKINGKLIELEYEKEINEKLRDIITNDSNAICSLTDRITDMDKLHKREVRDVKKQRNIAGGIGIGAIILLIISIL